MYYQITAFATLRGSLFMQSLIDDYIVPMTKARNTNLFLWWAHLPGWNFCYWSYFFFLAYNKIMVYISQGTMRNLRVELFLWNHYKLNALIPMHMEYHVCLYQ